ncbi:MAG: DUF1847 domain-containing protein [Proteobacteria bacterium]|nr:DUF1847 domain-containing protein [Pseudomonadota bacterium]
MESTKPECAKCGIKEKICRSPQGQGPAFCPTLQRKESVEKALAEYAKPGIGQFAREASIQEAEGYGNRNVKPYLRHPIKPRVQETCEFARRMGYKKLGIAFCAGLHREALALTQILEAQGFEVASIVCKAGCTPKETIGIGDEDKVRIGEFESMCSPIAQAMILNEEKTDFNILVGLCVGHDSLFLKYSKAYSTVLVTKDRVMAHNPAGALYTSSSYYERMLRKGF